MVIRSLKNKRHRNIYATRTKKHEITAINNIIIWRPNAFGNRNESFRL